jgi:hypothetical protein
MVIRTLADTYLGLCTNGTKAIKHESILAHSVGDPRLRVQSQNAEISDGDDWTNRHQDLGPCDSLVVEGGGDGGAQVNEVVRNEAQLYVTNIL